MNDITPDGPDRITEGILGGLLVLFFTSEIPSLPSWAADLRWSAVGLLGGWLSARFLNRRGRGRTAAVALFGIAGAYIAGRSVWAPPTGLPVGLQAVYIAVGALLVAVAGWLLLQWDQRGRHRGQASRRRPAVG